MLAEAELLVAQLRDMLAQLFPADVPPPAAPPAAPPTAAQATALRRALAGALPDRVARRVALGDTMAEQQLVLRLGDGVKPAVLRKAFVGAQAGAGELLWLPPSTELARARPKAQYVVFFEIEQRRRPYLTRATAIEPSWLADASAALVRFSPPVRSLPPRYEPADDATLCWVTPTYGAAAWELPVVTRAPPANDVALRAALFGRALCEGSVLRPLRDSGLAARAAALTDAACADGGALALRGRLADRRVCGLGDLAAVWAAEPRWLLAELTRLLPPPRRAALAEAWPRLLPAAQKALRKRT